MNNNSNKISVYKFNKKGETIFGKMHTRNVFFNSKTNSNNPAIVYTSQGMKGIKKSRINLKDINEIKLTQDKLNTKPFPTNLVKIEIIMNKSEPKIFYYLEEMNKPSHIAYFIEDLFNLSPNFKITGNYLPNVTENDLNALLNNKPSNFTPNPTNLNNLLSNENTTEFTQEELNLLNELEQMNKGGSQFIHIPNYGKRKIRYQKNGRPYVIVKGKKIKL